LSRCGAWRKTPKPVREGRSTALSRGLGYPLDHVAVGDNAGHDGI
jgi:hypothetical protein